MKNIILVISSVIFLIGISPIKAQQQDTLDRKCFVGTSLFVFVGNFAQVNTPDFAQLNFGYRLTPKDAISIELKTWKYACPLGIPYGSSFEAPGENFPGFIREKGFALAYQHFWWKGLYSAVHVMNAWQSFVNTEGEKIDTGFQIFNTYRLGYQIKLWNNRFFIEPNIAITHRPFQTEMPASFKEVNDRWPKYFLGEPGFHLGFNF
ncbi:MAG: hypothetical protein AAGG68_23185 [Bacteroidota bacterium]